MRMKWHSMLIKIRSASPFLAVALTDVGVFPSKAKETYEASLAELSKVLIKGLWKMLFWKNLIWLVFLYSKIMLVI